MQTLKTCTLDDGKKHVCFDDLKDYWRKDEYFDSLNEVEKAQVKQNLGILDNIHIDNNLNKLSRNPVQNRVLTIELNKKLDIEGASKVALTGQYSDLKNQPCTLPNPQGLIIQGGATQFYDGTERVTIEIPTKMSELENDSEYIQACQLEEAIPIKGISVNGIDQRVDFEKIVNINVPTRISDLSDYSNFLRADEVQHEVTQGSLKPVSGEAVANEIARLQETIQVLAGRITALENLHA